MKSLMLALVGLLTTFIVFFSFIARFSEMGPITVAEAASSGDSSPYTAFARRPLSRRRAPRYLVTAHGSFPPNASGTVIMSRRGVQGGPAPKKMVRLIPRHNLPSPDMRLPRFRPLPGYQAAFTLATNHRHQFVGYCHFGASGAYLVIRDCAFLWQQGRMHILATLPDYQITSANAINDKGIIVGDASIDSFPADVNIPSHAVCWVRGRIHDLGIGTATAININGAIVGGSPLGTPDCPRDPHALLWTHGYRYDLNDCIPKNSGWVLAQANGIDAHGRITGYGSFHGQPRAFLLTSR